jgi:hypothetical protein
VSRPPTRSVGVTPARVGVRARSSSPRAPGRARSACARTR